MSRNLFIYALLAYVAVLCTFFAYLATGGSIVADDTGTPTFWAISGESLMVMLREVADGADPDMVYAEHYANSGHEGTCIDCGHGWLQHGDHGCAVDGCRCTEPGGGT